MKFQCLSSQWRHNGGDGVSNHRRLDCLPNRLFRRRSKKTSKPRVTGLCEGNSPVTGEFPAQSASNTEKSFHLMISAWMSSILLFYSQSHAIYLTRGVSQAAINKLSLENLNACLSYTRHIWISENTSISKNSLLVILWKFDTLVRVKIYFADSTSTSTTTHTHTLHYNDVIMSVSNHQPPDCLLNRLFRRSKENIKAPRHWPLCGDSPVTGEFPAQKGQ